jgi:DNA-binding beta-propeller fold protein YncE
MRKTNWAALLVLCTVALATIAAAPAPQGSGYHLLKKVVLGGDGGWDYLSADPMSHRLFISRGTHIVVVDMDGAVVGDVPNVQGTHGAQLVPEIGRGFSSNGRSNSVTIFDLKTLAPINEVKLPAADGPDGFMYDPASKSVFVFNAKSKDATAVNAKTGEVAGTVPLGGKPEAATADGAGHAWVNIEDKAQLVEFDTKEFKVLNTSPLATCEEPTGMAIDTAHKRLFIGCHSKVMLVADYSGKVVASLPIGQGVDAASFDPATQFAFASCGDGTITIAHEDSPDKYTVVETISTQRGARTMALDTANHRVFTVTADFNPPPAATPDNPNPRPVPVSGTFTLLVYGR